MHSVKRRLGSSLEMDWYLLCYYLPCYYLALFFFTQPPLVSDNTLSLSVSAVFTVVMRMRRRPRCMNMIMMDHWPRRGNATLAKHAGHERRYARRRCFKNLLFRTNI